MAEFFIRENLNKLNKLIIFWLLLPILTLFSRHTGGGDLKQPASPSKGGLLSIPVFIAFYHRDAAKNACKHWTFAETTSFFMARKVFPLSEEIDLMNVLVPSFGIPVKL